MRFLACALIALFATGPRLAQLTAQTPPATIPTMHGTALSGVKVDLPEALRGHTAILILSFSQDSRANVTTWFRSINEDYKNSAGVLYYSLPVLTGAPSFLRGVITRKIRESVSPPAQPRFVPVLDHEAEWKAAAGFSRELPDSETYLLLVDGAGSIRYAIHAGAFSAQAYTDLRQHLEQIKP